MGIRYSFHVFFHNVYLVFCCLLKVTLGLLPLKLIIGFFPLFYLLSSHLMLFIFVLFYQNLISSLVLQFCTHSVSFSASWTEVALYFLATTVITMSRLIIRRSVTASFLCIFMSNLKFILCILQILLVSSGSVEINLRPNGNRKNSYLSLPYR